MTTVTIQSGVAIGDPAGDGQWGDEQPITGDYLVLSAVLTNGNAPGNPSESIRVRYFTSATDYATVAAAIAAGEAAAKSLHIKPSVKPNGIVEVCTERIAVAGAFLYTWVEHPPLAVEGTITIYANQIA